MTSFRYSSFGKKIIRPLASGLAVLMLVALPALADTLDGARAKGLVGERPDGYVGAVVSPTPDTQNLITTVNAQRRTKYEQIAKQKGVHFVFNAQQSGLIWAEPGMDLTAEVIQAFDMPAAAAPAPAAPPK